MTQSKWSLSLILAFSLHTIYLKGQFTVGNTKVDSNVLATGLNTPWDLEYTSDSSLWFTERIGKVSRIDLKSGKRHLMLDIQNKVEQQGESGLLGMAILDNVAITRVYLVYTYLDSNTNFFERLVRYDYNLVQDTLISEQILIDSIPAESYHDGSRLVIANNQLFMTTGDAGSEQRAQDVNSLAGKVLRIDLIGGIPTDNPIKNSSVYSWGHRNAQGLCFANNFLYSSEHGPISDDEVNIIEKGRNYGWPDVPGFCDMPGDSVFCADSNVVEPLIAWTPTLAVSDLCYYDHSAIPEWQGSLLMTTLKASKLVQLKLNQAKDSISGTADFFKGNFGRIRAICSSPSGDVYLATNSNPQQIIRLFNSQLTSLEEIESKENQIVLGPNPTKNRLLIESEIALKSGLIEVYSMEGKKLLSRGMSGNKSSLRLSQLPKGIYLVKVSDRKQSVVKKILID